MKKILVLLGLILSGCTTMQQVPPTIIIPQIPNEFLVDPGELEQLPNDSSIEDLANVINNNYKKYHQAREQLKSINKYIDELNKAEKSINVPSKD